MNIPPIKQAVQYSTKGHPSVIATRAERTPLAISLAFMDSDAEFICERIININLHWSLLEPKQDAMITTTIPPVTPAIIMLIGIIDGTAWNGMGKYGWATLTLKVAR